MSWSEKILSGDWPATIQSVAGTVAIAVFVVTFLAQAFTIPSESMEQTLLIGDYLLVDKLCYGDSSFWNHILPYRNIRRGDVVVFHYPVNPAQDFVKRVVALPGDRVRLINKRVFVNGNAVEEGYVQFITKMRNPYRDDFPRTDIPDYGVDAKWWKQMPKLVEDHQLMCRRIIILCSAIIAMTARTAVIGDSCLAKISLVDRCSFTGHRAIRAMISRARPRRVIDFITLPTR